MRKGFLSIPALLFICWPTMAAPEEGVDLTLPRSTDRYIPGLISGEEAEVDRRMEVTEKEQSPAAEPKKDEKPAEKSPLDTDAETYIKNLFKDQTVINLMILGVLVGIFILYRLRSGGSRR